MYEKSMKKFTLALIILWILLILLWVATDLALDSTEFGPLNSNFLSNTKVQLILGCFFITSVPIAFYVSRNNKSSLLGPTIIVILLVAFYISGITYLSEVGDSSRSVSHLLQGVIFYGIINLIFPVTIAFYSLVAFLYCWLTRKLINILEL